SLFQRAVRYQGTLLQCGELICGCLRSNTSRSAAEDEGAAEFGGPLIFAACCAPRRAPRCQSDAQPTARVFTPRNCRVGPESNVRFWVNSGFGISELSARLENNRTVKLNVGFPRLASDSIGGSPTRQTAGSRFLYQTEIALQIGFGLSQISHLDEQSRGNFPEPLLWSVLKQFARHQKRNSE